MPLTNTTRKHTVISLRSDIMSQGIGSIVGSACCPLCCVVSQFSEHISGKSILLPLVTSFCVSVQLRSLLFESMRPICVLLGLQTMDSSVFLFFLPRAHTAREAPLLYWPRQPVCVASDLSTYINILQWRWRFRPCHLVLLPQRNLLCPCRTPRILSSCYERTECLPLRRNGTTLVHTPQGLSSGS